MNVTYDLESMLAAGFTAKFAKYLLSTLEYERTCPLYDPAYRDWAHGKGFLAEYASAYGINEGNWRDFLSDYDFYRVWPLNGWARIWINDKLTLKQVLSGTEYEHLLPHYYFYSMPGGLRPLADCHLRTGDALADFVNLLKAEGTFACKPNNDTMSKGFVRLTFADGEFAINGTPATEADVRRFVGEHPNYVFQEYIRPGGVYGEITPLIHTLRVLVINEDGVSPKIVRAYFRFPCKWSGEANYIALDGVNKDVYTIYADVDVETGRWGGAKLIYANRVEAAPVHPDSGKALSGEIAGFGRLRQLILGIADRLNACEYMGFDIGITDRGFRLMEINSHPEIRGFQCFRPMFATPEIADYFKRKLAALDKLTPEQRKVRNGIPR